jgi:hypothetical protein
MANRDAAAAGAGAYTGSRFSDVRAQLLSDPYTTLPRAEVSIGRMFDGFTNLLKRDSLTILRQEADLVPPKRKLVNPVGICHFGKWRMTEETPYTGCFRTGTEHLIIVRCSNQFSNTSRGTPRGFGFAGKIFPTLDPEEVVKTLNFICIDDLAERHVNRYADVEITNEPPLTPNVSLLYVALVAANIIWVFNQVDSTPNYRPLYALAGQGLAPGEKPRGPKWIGITTEKDIGRSDAADFRDELRVKNYKDGILRFVVSGADEKKDGKRQWRRIGVIELNEDVCSASGDQRLRFHHDPNRRR